MPSLKGDNYTKQDNPTSDNVLSPGTLGGRERVLIEEITLAAAAIGDTVDIGRDLQSGAYVTGVEVQNAALGAGVTYRIGDSNDDDRYMTDIAAAAAATTTAINIAGRNYKIGTNSGDGTIQLKVGGAAATGLVKFLIRYTED